ncbi:MAG: lipoyl synthase [Desulfobacterales bacterium]|jgi:lipoic acid synthetase
MTQQLPKKPRWLKKRLPTGPAYEHVKNLIGKDRLHTVCQEAKCPNIWECYSQQTATFLIMGSRCTRNCRFCSVAQGPTGPPDPDEPARVADAARQMALKYVVITSVTRDDLADGGASHFAETIIEIRRQIPAALIEVLIPDFQGDADALQTVLNARPDVLNHNIETVPRLYTLVRPQARYKRSLHLLERVRSFNPKIPTKSGLMLGLGETSTEIRSTLNDLVDVGCRMLTLGQYLQPSKAHLPVKRFVTPEEFDQWRQTAVEMGFSEVASGPFVRSSYHAKELYQAVGPLILKRDAAEVTLRSPRADAKRRVNLKNEV